MRGSPMSDETEVTVAADLTAADLLEHLDREIAELTTARAVLARLLGVEDEAPGEVEGQASEGATVEVPAPKKSRPASGAAALARAEESRLKIARAIRDQGPLGAKQISEATGLNKNTVNPALKHPWFKKQAGNLFAPYELSPEGSAAVTEIDGRT